MTRIVPTTVDNRFDLHATGSAASPPGVVRESTGCGSTYVDTRYGVASPISDTAECAT